MLMDPHPSQQHAGLHHAVWQLQQEVTRLKARFKPTSPKKSGVDGGANQVPTYLGQSLHLYSPWWSSLAIITSSHCISGVCPMMQHPVQPYKGLSPRTAVAKTGVPGGKTTAEKPPENYWLWYYLFHIPCRKGCTSMTVTFSFPYLANWHSKYNDILMNNMS